MSGTERIPAVHGGEDVKIRVMGTSAVLVGREAQVEVLQEILHGTLAGRPPVMLVAGEAGVGKTALVDHVLAGAGQPVRRGWAAGRKSAVYEVLAQVLTPASGQSAGLEGAGHELALVLPRARPATGPGQPVGASRGGGRGSGAHGRIRSARCVP